MHHISVSSYNVWDLALASFALLVLSYFMILWYWKIKLTDKEKNPTKLSIFLYSTLLFYL